MQHFGNFADQKSYSLHTSGNFLVYLRFYRYLDFPKSAVRGSWKRRTFVTRKRAKITGAFLLR
jgi:hypothetical protein